MYTLGHTSVTTYVTQRAEINLITRLLKEPYFRETGIHRRIAAYPNAHVADKNKIITFLMKHLWEKGELTDAFRAFDYFLAAAGARGHFMHQFEVFLLGMNIILKLQDTGHSLKDIFGFDDIDRIIYCWLLTSSAHDQGYPLQSLDDVLKEIGDLYAKIKMEQLSESFRSLEMPRLLKDPEFAKLFIHEHVGGELTADFKIGDILYAEIIKSLEISPAEETHVAELQKKLIRKVNHGYVSSVLLCKAIINELLEKETPSEVEKNWKYRALCRAMAGISLHALKIDDKDPAKDDSFIISKISFNKNPYAYLLFVVDNIQDWGRGLFPDVKDEWPEYILDDFKTTDRDIVLDYRIEHETWAPEINNKVDNYLKEKREMLQTPVKTDPKLGIDITLNFTSNIGKLYDPIILNI